MGCTFRSFQIVTSIRTDAMLSTVSENLPFSTTLPGGIASHLYMLSYHRDRMLNAARAFQWPKAVDVLRGQEGLERLEEVIRLSMRTSSNDDSHHQTAKV